MHLTFTQQPNALCNRMQFASKGLLSCANAAAPTQYAITACCCSLEPVSTNDHAGPVGTLLTCRSQQPTSKLLHISLGQSFLDLKSVLLTVQLVSKLLAPLPCKLVSGLQRLWLKLGTLMEQSPGARLPKLPGLLPLLLYTALHGLCHQHLCKTMLCHSQFTHKYAECSS